MDGHGRDEGLDGDDQDSNEYLTGDDHGRDEHLAVDDQGRDDQLELDVPAGMITWKWTNKTRKNIWKLMVLLGMNIGKWMTIWSARTNIVK